MLWMEWRAPGAPWLYMEEADEGEVMIINMVKTGKEEEEDRLEEEEAREEHSDNGEMEEQEEDEDERMEEEEREAEERMTVDLNPEAVGERATRRQEQWKP
jgi:hypothetical protein